jgi:carbamoyltransferase
LIILGVSDGPHGGAAVVENDRVVSAISQPRLVGEHTSHRFPWEAVDAALAMAGATPDDVDLVGVAGRITPLLFVRRRPRLRRMLEAPFSPALDLQVFWQAVLRYSGGQAYDADVAAEWLDARFAKRGFGHARLVTVDIHRALAAGAYRMQPDDDALVITLHPMGDGVAVAVHDGRAGQLDLVFHQPGFSALHVHLLRVVAAMGLRPGVDTLLLDDLASHGTPDSTLVRLLAGHVSADGPVLTRSTVFRRPGNGDEVYSRIAELSRVDAAASVLDNLTETVRDLVRHHVRRAGASGRTISVAGGVFEYPRIAAAVAEIPEVGSLSVQPGAGSLLLPVGAAATLAGLAPQAMSPQLGLGVNEDEAAAALSRGGLRSVRKASLVDLLCRGEAVLRFRGRESADPISQGDRCVLVRADDVYAIARVREALGRPAEELPRCLVIPTLNEEPFEVASKAATPLATGALAPIAPAKFAARYPGVVAPDGRVHVQRVDEARQPGIFQVIKALKRYSGCAAVAAFPIVEGDGPVVRDPSHVVEIWRRCGFAALQLGSHYVERDV